MNTFDPSKELRQLLPWYENGTLDEDERDAVHALLATDLEANRQRRELRALHDALADDSTLASNMEVNLRRLRARMSPAPSSDETYVPMPAGWLALAVLLILALGVVTFFAGARVGSYHTLSAPEPALSLPADAELVRVAVVPGIDATALTQLAGDPQVKVLRGPSERGVATLAVPRARAQQIIARLSVDPRLRFVAPVSR